MTENSASTPSGKLQKIGRFYSTTAIMFFNTIVLFVIVNLFAVLGLKVWEWTHPYQKNTVPGTFDQEGLREVYKPMKEDEFQAMLKETWSRPMAYEQFIEIKERAFAGKYVNVSEHGFRIAPQQGPWPIDLGNYNIFMFGGSTTFGYGLPDNQTIPAQVQEIMNAKSPTRPVRVYNFGQGFFFSTPERILFEQLLLNGAKPDFVVFMDGLNDFYFADGVFAYTNQMKDAMDNLGGTKRTVRAWRDVLGSFPIGELINKARSRLGGESAGFKLNDPNLIPNVVKRYVWNKRAIELVARDQEIGHLFVFQPSPIYEYDVKYHLLKRDDWDQAMQKFQGYQAMAAYKAQHPMGDDFLWLADMQKGVQKALYCDHVHYTAEFSRDIALKIVDSIESARARGR